MTPKEVREVRVGELLTAIVRGGLDERQLARVEAELSELRESARRERVQRESTVAGYQPSFKHLDSFT